MPKVKELGITVIPEGFGPVEMGPGGCGCTNVTNPCNNCTHIWTFAARPQVQCTDCTYVPYSICGTTPGRAAQPECTDCTFVPYSICGTTPQTQCTDCTFIPASICGTTPRTLGPQCTDCTHVPFSICGTTPRQPVDPITPVCAGSRAPDARTPQLTREQIAQIRAQLQQQLAALDEAEKALLPKSVEELDAREKELTAELERLTSLRKELNRK